MSDLESLSESSTPESGALSRRALIGGAAALAGGVGLAAMGPAGRVAAAPTAIPEVLADPIDGLIYTPLDGFAFDVVGAASDRIYAPVTGVQPLNPGTIYAPLTIPIGSVIKQINVAYQTQPIVGVWRRELGSPTPTAIVPATSLTMGSGPSTETLVVDAPITQGASYYVEVFCSAGSSILGMTFGCIPPAQALIPYVGSEPRVLDTRDSSAFQPDEERVIDLSGHLIPTARTAVINLTAVDTTGPGFLAAFADGATYAGNSSLNFTATNQVVANGVLCPMTDGKIKVRCGPAGTDVLVDAIGSIL